MTNAENYQVLVSLSSSFTDPEVVYFGSQTQLIVSVAQGSTKYAKIRACNGSGCGSYTGIIGVRVKTYAVLGLGLHELTANC